MGITNLLFPAFDTPIICLPNLHLQSQLHFLTNCIMTEEIIPLKTADSVSGGLSKVELLERDAADFF